MPGAGPAGETALPDYERLYATYEPFLDVFDLPMPTIAAMNGHAVGGGFGLALVCDLRVANREARYGANFARLGFHSGMAISHLLPRIVGVPLAADLLFTGRLVTGAEAAAIGLAHEAVAPDEVLPTARARARAVAACAPEAVRLMKRSLYRGAGWDPRSRRSRRGLRPGGDDAHGRRPRGGPGAAREARAEVLGALSPGPVRRAALVVFPPREEAGT